MIVFTYIEDKDVFQKFYSKWLAKRLVTQASASDDAESTMISKLKTACGFEYTSKLQRMFLDVGVSKDLNEAFKRYIETSEQPLNRKFCFSRNSKLLVGVELIFCFDFKLISISWSSVRDPGPSSNACR